MHHAIPTPPGISARRQPCRLLCQRHSPAAQSPQPAFRRMVQISLLEREVIEEDDLVTPAATYWGRRGSLLLTLPPELGLIWSFILLPVSDEEEEEAHEQQGEPRSWHPPRCAFCWVLDRLIRYGGSMHWRHDALPRMVGHGRKCKGRKGSKQRPVVPSC